MGRKDIRTRAVYIRKDQEARFPVGGHPGVSKRYSLATVFGT